MDELRRTHVISLSQRGMAFMTVRNCFLIIGVFALGGTGFSGCGMTLPPDDRALEVDVTDAVTGDPIRAAEVIASSGEYRTWLWEMAGGSYVGAYRAGTYTITIHAVGYEDVVAENVTTVQRLDGDYHGFDTQYLNVRMERVAGG